MIWCLNLSWKVIIPEVTCTHQLADVTLLPDKPRSHNFEYHGSTKYSYSLNTVDHIPLKRPDTLLVDKSGPNSVLLFISGWPL